MIKNPGHESKRAISTLHEVKNRPNNIVAGKGNNLYLTEKVELLTRLSRSSVRNEVFLSFLGMVEGFSVRDRTADQTNIMYVYSFQKKKTDPMRPWRTF